MNANDRTTESLLARRALAEKATRGRGTPTAKALGLEPSIRRSKSVPSDMHVVTISSVT